MYSDTTFLRAEKGQPQWCRSTDHYQTLTLPIEFSEVLALADARTYVNGWGGVAIPKIEYTNTTVTITDQGVYTPGGSCSTYGMCIILGI